MNDFERCVFFVFQLLFPCNLLLDCFVSVPLVLVHEERKARSCSKETMIFCFLFT